MKMWRRKKFIVAVVLATVVLVGGVGGAVLAQNGNEDQNQPQAQHAALLDRVCAIYGDNTGVAIDPQALQAAFAQAHSGMRAEHMEGRLPQGPMAQVFESLGVEQEAVQAALDQARTELEDGTLEGGRGAVMAKVLEILGIDEQDWQAACAEVQQAHQKMCGEKPEGGSFGPGFGFRGDGGSRSMGGSLG